MAIETPRRPEEDIHGEPEVKPRFGPGSDDARPAGNPTDPRGHDVAAGDASDPRGNSVASSDDLRSAEQTPSSAMGTGDTGRHESSALGKSGALGKGYSVGDKLPGVWGNVGHLAGRFMNMLRNNPKKSAGTAAGGGIIGLVVLASSILQGPFQFVQLAQLLQKFHLTENQDFGDGRASRVLLYALAGDAERGRLGVMGNKFADSYERKLADAGLRPAYDNRTGRFVGFVTDDPDVADAIRRESGNKVEIKKVSDTNGNIKGSRGSPDLDGNSTFIDARDCSFGCRRGVIRNVAKSTGTYRLTSALNSRLLIKRGGVNFHVLNKVKERAERSEFIKKILRQNAEDTREGTEKSRGLNVANTTDNDGDGQPDSNPDAEGLPEDVEAAAEEGNSEVDEDAGENSAKGIYRNVITRAGSAALMVGAMCAAQDFGDNVADYKYTNNMLPMMRMGWKVITMGNQVMSGDDFDLDSLSAYNTLLYDKNAPKGERSIMNAKTIQAELNKKQTGPDLPEEARLKNINDKPAFFDLLNKVPGLGTACAVSDAFFGLPIISDISGLVSDITMEVTNAALSPLGTSVEDLAARALAVVAGDTVNPYAKGAEFGNLANTGAFIAGSDQAVANGGRPLENQEVAELKAVQHELEKSENSQKTFAQRYLDIYNPSSFVGSLSISLSGPLTNLSYSLSPSGIFDSALNTLGSFFTPSSVKAATNHEDLYGIPKFGFSLSEQNNDKFEDPYENAAWVEEGDRLEKLSDKYEKCFGMKIIKSGDTIKIEAKDQTDTNNGNIYKVSHDGNYEICRNNTEELQRYRFYLADAVTAISLACYEGDSDACTQLGIEVQQSPGGDPTTGSGGTVSGTVQELAQQLLDLADRGKIDIDNYYSEDPASDEADRSTPKKQLEDLAGGDTAKGSTRCGHDNREIQPDVKILQFLVDLGGETRYSINSLFGQCHSSTSLHYKGKAVDFGCNFDIIGTADRIGQSYGVTRNFETCAANGHWHYSVGGG